ncbi:SDR family oxidoreductase [Sphingomonas sp.]|uniref:SDR family oxidoreductase n=1 Tax=Sphingomonas sp. TaxID=28214 RepID=UPI0025CFEB7F|nr:SDR family oxidoreductase [Sphingomonas sp.]
MSESPSFRPIAFVTGAESGIGAACAGALAAAGHDVAVLYFHDIDAANSTVAVVTAAGGRAVAVRADVADEGAVEAAFDKVIGALGVPTVLVNSAGLNQSGVTVADMTLAQWQRLIGSDLTGPFLTSRRFVRERVKAGGPGCIINISSIHAEDVRVGAADYCSAKGGLKKLTETMALECAGAGITVNAIAPGMILTPMNAKAQADAAYRAMLEAAIPVKRAGTAEEVAALAVYLASPAATYITGTTVTIDGGLSLVLAQGA